MSEWAQFVEALGTRYSGTFTPQAPAPASPATSGLLPITIPGLTPSAPSAPATTGNPPDNVFNPFTKAQQAAFLNDADYMAWRDPRVRSVAQFLLYDARPNIQFPPGSFNFYVSTLETGLLFLNGRQKPSFAAYGCRSSCPRPRVAPGGRLSVWGQLRSAPNATQQIARIPVAGRIRRLPHDRDGCGSTLVGRGLLHQPRRSARERVRADRLDVTGGWSAGERGCRGAGGLRRGGFGRLLSRR